MTFLIILMALIIGIAGVSSNDIVAETTIELYQSRSEEFLEYEDDSIYLIDYPDVDYKTQFVDCPDEEYRNPYEVVEAAIRNREPMVSFTDELYGLYWADVGVMPYGSFWVKSITSSHYSSDGKDYNVYYFEYHDLTDYEIEQMKSQIDEEIEEIILSIPEDASDFEKAKTVHDILIERITYDDTYERDYRQNIYGGLIKGYAVCCGYACCYAQIMNAIGIPCQIVQNDTHSFNKIGSSYIDVTWDDWDQEGIVSYYFMGMSYEQITKHESHEVDIISFNEGVSDCIVPYYFEFQGYMFSEYDYEDIVAAFQDQISKGITMPTILFTNESAYEDCKESMQSDFWPMVSDTGYSGPSEAIYHNDDRLTWGFI